MAKKANKPTHVSTPESLWEDLGFRKGSGCENEKCPETSGERSRLDKP